MDIRTYTAFAATAETMNVTRAAERLNLTQSAPISTPNAAREAGIAMVFQETSLVPSMTVAQNLYLGSEKFLNRLRGTCISARQFLQSLNSPVDPAAMVETLGAAKKQMVEIARAVHHHNAEVIIFGEPIAASTWGRSPRSTR